MSSKTSSLFLASAVLVAALSSPASNATPRVRDAVNDDATPTLLAQKKGKKAKAAPAKKATPVAPDERPAPSDPRTQAADPVDDSGGATGPGGKRGPSRLEFDDRLVQGQTNKANAIYLFERRESALRSLLKKRTNFHDEIDETLQ